MIENNNLTSGHAYMERALQLSACGDAFSGPNPFVGAVIVADGRIIGEGYHRRFGDGHAEVNAVASVAERDRHLLREATMYVTLEPCSHFGKTPPCADLIISCGIPKVVVSAEDPFLKDYESGIDRMRNAGIEVEVGLLRDKARWINRRFFTAHTLHRPFVLLKWAQSADGFIAEKDGTPVALSSPFTKVLMHRERALYDAIMVGVDTVINDNPRLDCRLWPARDRDHRPLKVTFDSPRLCGESTIERAGAIKTRPGESLDEFLNRLYSEFKITSLMVEGGRRTLQAFLDAGLFDEIRVETALRSLGDGIPAPDFAAKAREHGLHGLEPQVYGDNTIKYFVKNY